MGLLSLWVDNWFTLLQSAGIIGGLLFTGFSLRRESRAKQIANLITITRQHRDIWTELYRRPDLSRVLDPDVDLWKDAVTLEEELFVGLLIHHLNSVYHAMQAGMFMTPEGLRRDIQGFFSVPIPSAVWERFRRFQDKTFVRFIEECLSVSKA